jgi:hypothetical protein
MRLVDLEESARIGQWVSSSVHGPAFHIFFLLIMLDPHYVLCRIEVDGIPLQQYKKGNPRNTFFGF